MKKLTTLFLLSFFAIAANAQIDVYEHSGNDRVINLRSQMIGNEVSISVEKSSPGFHSIYLVFDKSRNYRNVRDVFRVIEGSGGELIRFARDSVNGIPSYTYSHYPGAVNSKVKHDFTYRLPFADGKCKNVRVARYDDSDRNIGRVVYNFKAEEEEDIYAMRKGIVINIEDAEWYLDGVADNKTLRKANKIIEIEHADGSVARYHGVQDGTVTVALGDVVFPDKIIGKTGTIDDVAYRLGVSIGYLTCPMKGVVPDFSKIKRRYIEPYFATSTGALKLNENTETVCKAGDDLITAEMTKREKKNRNKK